MERKGRRRSSVQSNESFLSARSSSLSSAHSILEEWPEEPTLEKTTDSTSKEPLGQVGDTKIEPPPAVGPALIEPPPPEPVEPPCKNEEDELSATHFRVVPLGMDIRFKDGPFHIKKDEVRDVSIENISICGEIVEFLPDGARVVPTHLVVIDTVPIVLKSEPIPLNTIREALMNDKRVLIQDQTGQWHRVLLPENIRSRLDKIEKQFPDDFNHEIPIRSNFQIIATYHRIADFDADGVLSSQHALRKEEHYWGMYATVGNIEKCVPVSLVDEHGQVKKTQTGGWNKAWQKLTSRPSEPQQTNHEWMLTTLCPKQDWLRYIGHLSKRMAEYELNTHIIATLHLDKTDPDVSKYLITGMYPTIVAVTKQKRRRRCRLPVEE